MSINTRNRLFLALILILLVLRLLMFIYHISYPVYDQHSLRQTHNLMITRHFCRDGINLFLPQADNYGEVNYTLLELPIYQGMVAGLTMMFNGHMELFGRLVSIFATLITALFIFLICSRYLSRIVSLAASLIFLNTPLVIFYSRAIMIEPIVVMLTIISLYLYLMWIERGTLWIWALAVIFGCLAVLHKPMYALAVYIPIVAYQYQKRGIRGLINVDFLLSLIIPCSAAVAWLYHGIVIGNLFPNTLMLSSAKLMYEWYFGTIAQRLNPIIYAHIIARSAVYILGIIGLVPLLMALAKWRNVPRLFLAWIAGAVMYVLIFINLNYVHDYYQYPLIPILAVLQAIGLEEAVKYYPKRKINKEIILALALIVMFIVNTGISLDRFGPKNKSLYDIANIASQYIPNRSNVIFIGDWLGAQPFYHADFKGLTFVLSGIDIRDLRWQVTKNRIRYYVIIGELTNIISNEVRNDKLLHSEPIVVKNEKGKVVSEGKIYIYEINSSYFQ